MPNYFSFLLPVFVVPLALLGGCTSNLPEGLPKRYPCEITVIQDDKPLGDATVTLQSSEVGQQWFPMGTTGTDGVATMLTNGQYPGAPAGNYKVLVYKGVVEQSKFGPPPPEDDPSYPAWEKKASNENLREYIVVEPQHNDPLKTPHEIEVKTKGPNKMTVDVGKAVKILSP